MTTFTDGFNGGTINPAWVGYANYNITVNTTLVWPTLAATAANIVAGFMQCQATAGLRFIMPDATQTSTGTTCIFDNTGANSFTVVSSASSTVLLTVATATAWVLVLTDNSTVDGTWLTFQLGAGTSSAIAASLAGLGIKAITTTLNQEYPAIGYSTNQTILAANRASITIWTGGAGTFSLTTAATLGTGWFFNVSNQGTGTLSVSDAGGATINGTVLLTLNPGDSCILITNGVVWVTVGLGKSATFAISYIQIDISPGGTTTLASIQLNQIIYKFIGALTSNAHVIVPATVQQYWCDNETTGAFTTDIGTAAQVGPPQIAQGGRNIYYCDGTIVKLADTSGFATPLPISAGGTGATTQAGAQASLDVPSNKTALAYTLLIGG